jgi:mannose-6-phosphate isomerase
MADPEGLVGSRGLAATGQRPLFPLLVKLIDAVENLSIQVHPSDEIAGRQDRLGKTEAWHVLEASPGAVLFLGLQQDASFSDFAAACRHGQGQVAGYLRRVPAIPGTTVFIPAGTVHALGAGVLIYEIQQQSEITYRLNDWGRVDPAGVSRPLHLDDGFAAVDPASRPDMLAPIDHPSDSRRQLLVSCPYFALERLTIDSGETASLSAPGSPQVITCLQGAATIEFMGKVAPLSMGDSAVLTTSVTDGLIRATRRLSLLRTWVPDLTTAGITAAESTGSNTISSTNAALVHTVQVSRSHGSAYVDLVHAGGPPPKEQGREGDMIVP